MRLKFLRCGWFLDIRDGVSLTTDYYPLRSLLS
jgi:hypothetical protein